MYQNQPDGVPHLVDRVFEEKSVDDDFCLALVYRRLFTDARLSTLVLNIFFWQKNSPICILVVIMLYPLVFMLLRRTALLSPDNSDPLW